MIQYSFFGNGVSFTFVFSARFLCIYLLIVLFFTRRGPSPDFIGANLFLRRAHAQRFIKKKYKVLSTKKKKKKKNYLQIIDVETTIL